MSTRVLGVGIIGATATGSGWAKDSHVPAVKALPGLRLAAVATTNQKTADEAQYTFGAEAAFPTGNQLIQDSRVDIVTIATRVPDHTELALAAIAAGKHIYSEAPLARNTQEARQIAEAAQKAGIKTVIGLQLRGSPAVRKCKELLAAGEIGRVLQAAFRTYTAGFGPQVPSSLAYTEEESNGANLLTIQAAHTIDAAVALLGEFRHFEALLSTRFPKIEMKEDGSIRRRTTADHVAVLGQMESGAPVVIEVIGNADPNEISRLEITGTKGRIVLEGASARGVQAARLTLLVNGKETQPTENASVPIPEAALNVAGLYAMLRDTINGKAEDVPDFQHAVRVQELVDRVRALGKRGSVE